MGQLVVSVNYRLEICKRKMHQIDPEIVKKFDVFVVFEAISKQVPRDFVISSNKTSINERARYAVYFFEEKVAVFCFNDSKLVQKFNISTFFTNLYAFFESFWSQYIGKRSMEVERICQ